MIQNSLSFLAATAVPLFSALPLLVAASAKTPQILWDEQHAKLTHLETILREGKPATFAQAAKHFITLLPTTPVSWGEGGEAFLNELVPWINKLRRLVIAYVEKEEMSRATAMEEFASLKEAFPRLPEVAPPPPADTFVETEHPEPSLDSSGTPMPLQMSSRQVIPLSTKKFTHVSQLVLAATRYINWITNTKGAQLILLLPSELMGSSLTADRLRNMAPILQEEFSKRQIESLGQREIIYRAADLGVQLRFLLGPKLLRHKLGLIKYEISWIFERV